MEEKTIYRLYQDSDAEQMVKLLLRNHFYLGKTGRDITADEYRHVQKLRGMLFAVVGERNGNIIAHIAIYSTEAQRIRKPWQLYMGTFLIDEHYKKHLYSLIELYKFVVLYIVKNMPEVTMLNSVISKDNIQSIYLQRKLGSFLLNSEADQHGEIEMYNCALGIYRFMMPSMVEKGLTALFSSCLPPMNRKTAMHVDELYEGRFGKRAIMIAGEQLVFLINVFSGHTFAVERQEKKQCLRADTKAHALNWVNSGKEVQCATVCFLDGQHKMISNTELKLETGSKGSIPYSPETIYIEVDLHETKYKFRFYVNHDDEFALPKPSVRLVGNLGNLEIRNGQMRFACGNHETFMEMWPCVTAPFLTAGGIIPNLELGLEYEQIGECEIILTQPCTDYKVRREYIWDDNTIKIHTQLLLTGDKLPQIEPVFQLYLNDFSGTVDFYAKEELIEHRKFDYERDIKESLTEILYYNYTVEPYSTQKLSSIELNYVDSTYRITSDQPVIGFGRFNYVAINPQIETVRTTQSIVELGTLTIERVL